MKSIHTLLSTYSLYSFDLEKTAQLFGTNAFISNTFSLNDNETVVLNDDQKWMKKIHDKLKRNLNLRNKFFFSN